MFKVMNKKGCPLPSNTKSLSQILCIDNKGFKDRGLGTTHFLQREKGRTTQGRQVGQVYKLTGVFIYSIINMTK